MDGYHSFNSSGKYPPGDPRRNPNGVKTQIELSVALGLIAFLIFCVIPHLYISMKLCSRIT